MRLTKVAAIAAGLWFLQPAMAQTVCDGTVCDGLKFGPGGYHPCSTKLDKGCMQLGDGISTSSTMSSSGATMFVLPVPYCEQGWVLVDVDSGAKRCAPVSQLRMPKETQ